MDLHRGFLLPTALLCGASSLAFAPSVTPTPEMRSALRLVTSVTPVTSAPPRQAKPTAPDFEPDIDAAAIEHGVRPDLIRAIIRTESEFVPTALSSRGACGLMQIMPNTARSLGLVDCFNARENIRAGARHLKRLLTRYDGSITLSVAAYNAGEAAVARHGGIPPYRQTRAYVRKVTALLIAG